MLPVGRLEGAARDWRMNCGLTIVLRLIALGETVCPSSAAARMRVARAGAAAPRRAVPFRACVSTRFAQLRQRRFSPSWEFLPSPYCYPDYDFDYQPFATKAQTYLHGKFIRGRVIALIQIADPKFCDGFFQYCERTEWL